MSWWNAASNILGINVRHPKDKQKFNVQQLVDVFGCWNNTSIQHFHILPSKLLTPSSHHHRHRQNIVAWCVCACALTKMMKMKQKQKPFDKKIKQLFQQHKYCSNYNVPADENRKLPMPSATVKQLKCICWRNHRQLFLDTASTRSQRSEKLRFDMPGDTNAFSMYKYVMAAS